MRIESRWQGFALALAVAAVGGAVSCSSSPAEPFTLPGTYHMLSVDSAVQAPFNPYYAGTPQTFITGALLEVFPTDSMQFTTYFTQFGTFPTFTRTTWSERFTIWPYTQSGDSLFKDGPGGPTHFGTIVGQHLDVVIRYPIPPSQGYTSASHEFVMTK